MNKPLDIMELIEVMPYGAMCYQGAIVTSPDSPGLETVFVIKEYQDIVRRFTKNPPAEIRAGLFELEGVLAGVVMIRMDNSNTIYETWFNIKADDDSPRDCIDRLITQPVLRIQFFNEDLHNIRSIVVRNSLKDVFRYYKIMASKMPNWSMRAFDKAKDIIYDRYPDGVDLWNYLSKEKGLG